MTDYPATLASTATLARLIPDSAALGPSSTNPDRPSAGSIAPRPGMLEGLGDALLQHSTISVVIQMATVLALQRLANFFTGKPGSENDDIL